MEAQLHFNGEAVSSQTVLCMQQPSSTCEVEPDAVVQGTAPAAPVSEGAVKRKGTDPPAGSVW